MFDGRVRCSSDCACAYEFANLPLAVFCALCAVCCVPVVRRWAWCEQCERGRCTLCSCSCKQQAAAGLYLGAGAGALAVAADSGCGFLLSIVHSSWFILRCVLCVVRCVLCELRVVGCGL
jgi:hypothetical protein